ncbi:MAG: hypothetical protein HY657_06390 [Acidobacteria bacterium]|nr:hypothetical protein [Acidobacteriota bacterium]
MARLSWTSRTLALSWASRTLTLSWTSRTLMRALYRGIGHPPVERRLQPPRMAALALAAAGAALAVPHLAGAQTAEPVEVAPIECWSRTSAGAVRVGEPFTLVLTCASLDTQAATVVVDRSRLDPAALQVPPFEVVSGRVAPDVRTSSRRLFQYEYSLRLLGDQFGTEVTLPGPTVLYRVQSRVDQGASLEGREREYLLPSLPIRILSLVPAGVTDIREPVPETFRAIADRRFRANGLRIAAFASFGLAGVMGAWALAGLLRRPVRTQAASPVASERAMLRRVLRELEAIRRERLTTGWTNDLAARALAAARIPATLAVSPRVTRTPWRDGTVPVAGQLLVRSRWPKPVATLVSGWATPETLAGVPELAPLKTALERFTSAAYGSPAAAAEAAALQEDTIPAPVERRLQPARLDDASSLDDALSAAEQATERLSRAHGWLARRWRSLARSATGIRSRAWAR